MLRFDNVNGCQPALSDNYRSPEVPHLNKEAYRSFFLVYDSCEEALTGDACKWDLKLDGQWRFRYCRDVHEPINGMEAPDYDDSSWQTITVPSCWQATGCELPLYSGCTTPFQPVREKLCPPEVVDQENSMGLYRTKFIMPDAFVGRTALLRFEGVESAFNVWVNGNLAGFGQNSFAPAEYNVTQYVHTGENVIFVQVYRWCALSHLEAQDMWRLSGIFRSVTLLSRPEVSILDMQVQTLLDKDYRNATLKVMMKVKNYTHQKRDPHFGEMTLYDADGKALGCVPLAAGYTGAENPDWPVNTWRNWPTDPKYLFGNSIRTVYMSAQVETPYLWSAETPYLYTLVLTLKDERGSIVETAVRRIGFRNVSTDERGRICVNGSPVLLKGVNYHEFSPIHMRATTREEMLKDILLMKRHNINAVRNAHYPHNHQWYDLCDEYGLYIMDEGNLETHDTSYKDDVLPGNDLRYTAACIDRMQAMVQVSKNSPSVIIYSMGNEMGYGQNVALMAAYCRCMDGTRLLHKRQMNVIADMDSDTYPGVDWVIRRAEQEPTRPFILNEYAHAMGNAMGNLKEYWDAIEKYDCLCGGFIWEWFDHGIAAIDEQGRHVFNHGGDYPTQVNSFNFCFDGVVSPDRRVTAKLKEVRATHAYVKAVWADREKGIICVRNGYSHQSTDFIAACWQLTRNGQVITQGELCDMNIAPGKSRNFTLPCGQDVLKEAGAYYLNISFRLKQAQKWAEAGLEVAMNQLHVGEVKPHCLAKPELPVYVQDSETEIKITGSSFECRFSKSRGVPVSWLCGGKRLLFGEAGPELQVYRAPTDNDSHSPSALGENIPAKYGADRPVTTGWLSFELDHLLRKPAQVSVLSNDQTGVIIRSQIVWQSPTISGSYFNVFMVWKIYGNGCLALKNLIQPVGEFETLPRIGLRLIVDQALTNLTWFGRGPGENYPDRKCSTPVGLYHADVAELMEHYECPQENGSRGDTQFVALTDSAGEGMLVRADRLFSFSALHCTAEMLNAAAHDAQIPMLPETVLSVDWAQNGLGNSSCGCDVMEEYRLKPVEASWALAFMPAWPDSDPFVVTDYFSSIPEVETVFTVDHSITCKAAVRASQQPFDPSDADARKRAGFDV